MGTLTIRNLDDAIIERLKTRARAHNRSLEAELREILGFAARSANLLEFKKEAARIAAMTPDRPQTDSVKLLRQDRRR